MSKSASTSVVTHLGRISFRLSGQSASSRAYTGLYAIQDGWSRKDRAGGIITMNFDRPVPDGNGDHVHGITIGVVLVPGLQGVLDDGEEGSGVIVSRLIGEWCAVHVQAKVA